MAGHDQNPQFPGSQSGFPAQVPGIPAVPSAGSNPQAIGGGPIPVAAPLSPVAQAIPLAQPVPVQPAGRQPSSAYPARPTELLKPLLQQPLRPDRNGVPRRRGPCLGPIGRARRPWFPWPPSRSPCRPPQLGPASACR